MQFLCRKVTKLFVHKATKSPDQKRTTNFMKDGYQMTGKLVKM